MKKLGLVGGKGPESTIPYYRDIVYGVQNKIGRDFFPTLTIESVNVFDRIHIKNLVDTIVEQYKFLFSVGENL